VLWDSPAFSQNKRMNPLPRDVIYDEQRCKHIEQIVQNKLQLTLDKQFQCKVNKELSEDEREKLKQLQVNLQTDINGLWASTKQTNTVFRMSHCVIIGDLLFSISMVFLSLYYYINRF
jgi:hypothetical protein